MNKQKTKQLTTAALFAGLVLVLTLTGAVTPIGGGAYIHIGDAMIYIAALVLPLPFAVAAAVIGAAFADLLLGSAIYIIPTVIIKALVVVTIKQLMKLTSKPALQDLTICLAGVVTVVGYYLAEVVILLISGSALGAALVTGAANSVLFNTVQALASAAVYMLVSGAVRKFISRKKDSNSEEK